MQINITGHHLEVTPALRAYATEKMQRLTRHFDHVLSVNITMSVEKHEQQAEATVHAAGRNLFATHKSSDMYAALDGLADKLDRQVRRHKGRTRDHNHINPNKVALNG